MSRIRRHLTFANVASAIALFVALTGGTAVALSGANTVFTDDIANDTQPAAGGNPAGGLVAADLRPNSVGSSEVTNFSLGNGDFLTGSVDTRVATNNSLTGDDVNEASLGQVPSALLGGFGRSNGGNTCNPEYPPGDYVPCAVVTLNVSRQARFLVIGQAQGTREGGTGSAMSNCQLGTTAGPISGSDAFVVVDASNDRENFSTAGVTGPFPPGQHSFGLDCRENSTSSGGIVFFNAGVTAVAISPG